ncbi:zinc metalloprotease [Hymenobacter qilianensis]|uniref:M48 family metallopeptidase n=2 Tax=Hymenobacter qilianensis TaxID=1385715 RepID=A0A7H0GVZ8_9BACT|nr:SprT family zinc-dependent metalloprotease [Hymenobacter qilianensis]QNP52464.1 M48 family metallopeptidase [Hymenobacter qilianensis]GGF67886.1 zinc metalloprotease [Hymenobacter qilianensis]
MTHLEIGGFQIELVRKNIRTLRLTVYAPDGKVRVAAPMRMPASTIEDFIIARQVWILKHQAKFAARERPVAHAYVSGETHFYQGQGYELQVLATTGRARVALREELGQLELHLPAESTAAQRQQHLVCWYRAQLKEQVPALLAKWEPVVGKQATTWGVKQMKTRWGTCNIQAKRIWLNLELIKCPPRCLEYVVVHELVHLHERYHNARFWGFMDQFMPDWRTHKAELSQITLGPAAGADAD